LALLPLSLGVRRSPDAGEAVSSDRPLTKTQMEKTLWRDAFACRCCGFTSKKYQRVIPFGSQAGQEDGADSLITVCTFCEMCFALERAGHTTSGILVWLPELSQAELNHVMRAIYVARASENPLKAAASRTLEVLVSRRGEAKKRLGTDDPLLFATALQEEVDDKTYAERTAKIEGIRLIPAERYLVRQRTGDTDIFPQMMSYWTSPEGPFGKAPIEEWTGMFENVASRVQE